VIKIESYKGSFSKLN